MVVVSVWCGWSVDEGWHLWATIQYCADLVLGDGSSAVGLRCVPRNHHELCGRLHDSHVARRRRLVCSQQSDCITSASSKNNRYDNYGCQDSAILHTQNFETKKMSETNDKKCSLQLTANCPKYCRPEAFLPRDAMHPRKTCPWYMTAGKQNLICLFDSCSSLPIYWSKVSHCQCPLSFQVS